MLFDCSYSFFRSQGRGRPLRSIPCADAPGSQVSGGHGGGVTPVPIPNTAVKPTCADGTWGEAPWESRSPPEYSSRERPSGRSRRVWARVAVTPPG
jgi:hypothetical protein